MASTVWRTRLQQVRPSVFGNSMTLSCVQAYPRPTKSLWTPNHYLRTRSYESAAYNPFLANKAARMTESVDKIRKHWEELAAKKGEAGPEHVLQAHNRMRDVFGDLSPSSTNLYHDIRSDKVDAAHFLQRSALDGKDLLEVIRVCLHGEHARLFALKRIDRRAAMRENLARIVLDRIWSREDLWRPLVLHDRTASLCLSYLAVAEGLADLLIQWLQVHDDIGSGDVREQALWRASLWRNIVRAHLMLNENCSADDSLRCFFDIWDLRKEHNSMLDKSPEKSLTAFALASAEPSCMMLDGELSTPFWCHNTDPVLYDVYINFRSKGQKKNPRMLEFSLASLYLTHPRNPKADLAYRFFWKCCEGKTPDSIAEAMKPVRVHRNRLEQTLKRTRWLLNEAGRHEDAAWIERMTSSIVASKLPRSQFAEHRILSERP